MTVVVCIVYLVYRAYTYCNRDAKQIHKYNGRALDGIQAWRGRSDEPPSSESQLYFLFIATIYEK